MSVMTRGRGRDWVCSTSAIPALGAENAASPSLHLSSDEATVTSSCFLDALKDI